LREIGGLDALDGCPAMGADDVREGTALERQQESSAHWIAEI
jgi:hypothetical protein